MHCRLLSSGTSYLLVDLESTNGTWVNGQRIPPRQPIPVIRGQRIMLGSHVEFPWNQIPATAATPPPPAPVAPGPGHTVSLHKDSITIGRAADNDLVLSAEIVSGHHARVYRKDGEYFVEDANSLNGTYVNASSSRITMPTAIREADEIFFGSYRVPAADLFAKFGASRPTFIGQQELKSLEFTGDSMTIGRDPACEHPIDFPVISWHHARITRTATGLYVEDLKSRNGTFVDGKRISSKTLVKPGQAIGLGSFRFNLLESGEIAQHRDTGYTIEARNITFHAKDGRQILAPISFTAYPGELIALMGTSGAGKTTLLKILNGYTRPNQGEVLYNGKNLYQHQDEHSSLIGYVPQDDIVHERLKVGEALKYSARLRTDYMEAEIDRKSREVAAALGLTKQYEKVIGSPENKILSGGQRKRVNIALELICDTPVLFLDEPTSGLSSADAEDVVENLRRLAKESGKTIIATIHAPSLEAYRMFDSVILLSKDVSAPGQQDEPGKMIYYGPACPASLEFVASRGGELSIENREQQLTPDRMMKGLQQDQDHPDPSNTADQWMARYQKSRFYRQYVLDRSGKTTQPDATHSGSKNSRIDWGQWIMLAQRNITVRFRDKGQVAIMLLQAPIFAALIYSIFRRLADPVVHNSPMPPEVVSNAGGIHFLLVVAAIWFGCNNAVRDVVGEWLIYKRERMVCLGLGSYVFSKLVVLNAICLLQCLVMLAIVYPACGLSGGFGPDFLVLWLSSLVGSSIGLWISSAPFCKTTESAIALMPIVLLPMIGLGGGLKPSYKMPQAAQIISYGLPSRWAFEANLVREAEERRVTETNKVESFPQPGPQSQEQPPVAPPCAPASAGAAARPAAAKPAVDEGDLAEQSFPKYIKDDERVAANTEGRKEHRKRYEHSLIALASMFLICITGVLISLKSRDGNLGQ